MAYTCVVIDCKNTIRKLRKWEEEDCEKHDCKHKDDECDCEKPFILHPFPTEKKNKAGRSNWISLINRNDEKGKLWMPSKDSRVCSLHFVDKKPTIENPNPTLYLGYDSSKRETLFSPILGKRQASKKRLSFGSSSSKRKENQAVNVPINTQNKKTCLESTETNNNILDTPQVNNYHLEPQEELEYLEVHSNELSLEMPSVDANATVNIEEETVNTHISITEGIQSNNQFSVADLYFFIIIMISIIWNIVSYVYELHHKIYQLEQKLQNLEHNIKQPLAKKLINENNCKFYTNIDKIDLFYKLHEKIAPLVKRRLPQKSSTRVFVTTPKKMGPKPKLDSLDEFLLTMMKLRLGLLNKDLSDRFNISEGLCTKIFHSWIRAMSEYLKNFVYMPDMESIISTTPERYNQFNNLSGIIDYSEIFIETPKNLELQSVTWSDYKHHNTLKFLIAIVPNSTITFISKAYTGRISDKKITIDSEYLDTLPKYTTLMADKGFNLFDECAARSLYFVVPPGRRGASQMTPQEVKKTGDIAKVRILVEQVIRRLKTFRIIANEVPISMLSHIDDILIICAALCNFKNPIYSD